MKKAKQFLSVLLCAALCVSTFAFTAQAKDARKYVKSISVKKKAAVTIPASKKTVEKTFKVTVKVNGKASKKFTAKSGKKSIAEVKVIGKKIKVTAKKAGKVKIKVTTKAKTLKKKKLSKTLTLTVKKAKASKKTEPALSNPVTQATTEETAQTPTEEATQASNETPTEEVTQGITEEVTEPETESGEPTEIFDAYFENTIIYSEYGDSRLLEDAQISIHTIIYEPKKKAVYTAEPENRNICDTFKDDEGNDVLYSKSLGYTEVDVYEEIEGVEKTKLGTISVEVEDAAMADVCGDALYKNGENYLSLRWLKLDLGKTTCDFTTEIKKYLVNNKEAGCYFEEKDFTVEYEEIEDESVASLSDKGVITGNKNGDTFFDYNIVFSDGSNYDSNCEVKVTGTSIEKVDGYTLDNIRDYIVGIDTPVELKDGTMAPMINFDNAATTPAFKAVKDAIDNELEMYGSIGRGFSQKSNHSTDLYNSVRDKVLQFLGADPEFYTCFYTNSTTDGLNKLASALIESEDDIVLTTRIEHHANDLSWRERVKDGNVIYAEVDEKGRVIYDDLEKLLKENDVKILSISAASNVTGYVNDIHRAARLAHKYGAKIVVDGAQIVAHRKVSMVGDIDDPDDDIDFIAFSAHKMYSPYGGGAVVGITSELNKHMPTFYGGGTIKVVGDDWVVYKDAPEAYEAGSPNYPSVVGLGKAIDILSTIGMDKIEEHEKVLNRKIIDGLLKLKNVIIYGDTENIDDKVGVVTFNFTDINTFYISESLSEIGGVATRRGAFCAHPYVWRLMGIDDDTVRSFENCSDINTAGMVRVSFGIYNNEEDVDKFLELMPEVMKDAKYKTTHSPAVPEY